MRKCIKCLLFKNQTEFSIKPTGCNICKKCKSIYVHNLYLENKAEKSAYNRKYRTEHKDSHRKNNKRWIKNNPEYYKKSQYKRLYGITLEQQAKLLEIQNNKCLICGSQFTRISESG